MIEKLKQLDIIVRENEPLKNHTTFQIGGPAKLYLEISSPLDLIEALKMLKAEKMDYLMLGGGSNLLVSDNGYNGAVIKMKPREIKIEGCGVIIDSGYTLAGLLMKTMETGLTGMEFAAGIPGTVGGAIKGNAGTFGEAMDKIIATVDFINDDLEMQTFTKEQCNFSYRHSIFKEHENWMVVSAVLKMEQGNVEASKKLVEERIAGRKDSQPYGFPSAGCVFKNLAYTDELAEKINSLGWTMPEKFKEFGKIPISWVVDHLEIKGKKIGNAQIAEKHGNYIINLGGAKAAEVVELISFMKQQVRDKIGAQLQEEVRYLGF